MDSILNVIMQGNEVYCFNYALTSFHNNIVYCTASIDKVCPYRTLRIQYLRKYLLLSFSIRHTSELKITVAFPQTYFLTT